jgi:hypothetical protein
MDERYRLIRERFETLSREELLRMRDNIDITLFDDFNYHEGQYCPIAIAMNLHTTFPNPTHELVKEKIAERFQPSNMLKGVDGSFYHGTAEERKRDLLQLIDELVLMPRKPQ